MGSSLTRADIIQSVNVKLQFGATGNGTTDDSGAIGRALAESISSKLPLYYPPGFYRLASPITYSASGQNVLGAGRRSTYIIPDAGVKGFIFEGNDQYCSDMNIGGTGTGAMAACAVQLGTNYNNYWFGERLVLQYSAVGLANDFGFDNSSLSHSDIKLCTVGTTQTTNVDIFRFSEVGFDANTTSAIDCNNGRVVCEGGVFGGNARAVRFIANGGRVACHNIHFEIATSGIYFDGNGFSNNGVINIDCDYQDGNVDPPLVHVASNNGFGSFERTGVSNNSLGAQVQIHGSGNPRFISPDQSALVTYNGAYKYIAQPWFVYNDGDSLPTPGLLTLGNYSVALWDGGTGLTSFKTFRISKVAGSYSAQQVGEEQLKVAYGTTSDPHVAGQLWNNLGLATFSGG